VACAVLMLIGCADSQAPEQQKKVDAAEQTISDLRAQLTKTDRELSLCRQENKDLLAKAESQASQLQKGQQQLATVPERESEGESIPVDQRVELLGAKALAEHQARQLKRRVEALSKDLGAKETELESI